jgi:hypothetical protein
MAAKKRPSRSAKSKSVKPKKKAQPPRAGKPVTKSKVRPLAAGLPEAARLQAELRESIDHDISDRISTHQREVVRLRAAMAARPEAKPPLMILAHGDSWFDYPLNGNKVELPIPHTDIIAHLRKMGSPPPKILNLSHFGDATTDEMGLEKQKRLIKALSNAHNWLDGKPDAILFSGGGNDIAGDPFCIYLNYKSSGLSGLDTTRFAGRLASVEASYRDLFAFRDHYAAGVPILAHAYDLARPIPSPHPPCTGPWMWPGLSFAGWNIAEGAQIIHDALIAFRDMLARLEASSRPNFNFTVIPTQGTLAYADWANELHPYPPGFQKLADKFLSALRSHFSGRI